VIFRGLLNVPKALASPTGHAVMYGDDSIKIELAGGAVERAA
jgi:hypothetical protein